MPDATSWSRSRSIDGLEEFNEQLAQSCEPIWSVAWGQPTTKQAYWKKSSLCCCRCRSSHSRPRGSNRQGQLALAGRFDTNDYSVPTAYAHHQVTAVGNVQEVRFIANDRIVASHRRCWGREHVHYDPLHYLALLERKPGALGLRRTPGGLGSAGLFWRAASPT